MNQCLILACWYVSSNVNAFFVQLRAEYGKVIKFAVILMSTLFPKKRKKKSTFPKLMVRNIILLLLFLHSSFSYMKTEKVFCTNMKIEKDSEVNCDLMPHDYYFSRQAKSYFHSVKLFLVLLVSQLASMLYGHLHFIGRKCENSETGLCFAACQIKL